MNFPKEAVDRLIKCVEELPGGSDPYDGHDVDQVLEYAEQANARIHELEQLLAQQNEALRKFQSVIYAIQKLTQ